MANPIIKIKRSTAATGVLGTPNIPTLTAGEFGVDQINKNLYLGLEDAVGFVTPVIVGGEGTFAKKTDVSNALTNGLKYKGEITITSGHLLDTDFMGAAGTMWEPPQTGFYYSVGSVTGGGVFKYGTPMTSITLVEGDALVKTATGWQRLVGGTALSNAISDLGDVFHYVGDVSSAATPLDLSTLSDTNTGAYYKVDVAGAYTDGATTFNTKVGDAFVKTTTGWQKLDNVDVEVLGTANEIAVSGDENAGYTVAIDPVFSGRVSDVESKTQNIDLAGTTAGTTKINDSFVIQGSSAEFTLKSTSANTNVISAKDGNITLGGAIAGGQIAVRTEKFVVQEPYTGGQVWEINEYGAGSNKLPAQGNKSSFNLDMDGNVILGAEVTNTSVSVRSAKLIGVDGSFGTPAIENFIIDGGSY